jgi:hypothetical protein
MHVEDCHGIDNISSTVHCSTAQRSTAVQCCTLQCNAAQCSNAQYCTMLLYTVRYLIAYRGLFIVIYNTRHTYLVCSTLMLCILLSVKYFKSFYRLHWKCLRELPSIILLHFPFCNLLFAFLFISFCSCSIQVHKSVSQKIMTHCVVIRDKIKRCKIAGLVR